jgi:ATP-dependent exoDNAse (exonuclease V) alpha subunit
MVQITDIEPTQEYHGVIGNFMTMNHVIRVFQPKTLDSVRARLKEARAMKDFNLIAEIENSWIDLRGAYAQTINKAQGSTYDRVYIDLDDVSGCRNKNQLARMLYVGVSRAKYQVFLTGDLV